MRRTVDRLREIGPTILADAGDFAAAADLDIDVGVVGNHEFEWGIEHLRSHAPETGYPLLCANSPESRLPPTAVVETDAGVVGFVAMTCPDPEAYVSVSPLEDDLAGVVDAHARELMDSGVEWAVALFHDGVEWRSGKRGYEVQAGRFAERYRSWADEVDVIFASHTLGRWMGRVEGTPVVQPWPFGAELGVVELAKGREPKTYGITPETGGRWSGTGSRLLDEASSRVLGEVDRPLSNTSGGPSALVDFFTRALREATGASAAAFDMLASQAPMDGVLSYLRAGPVTEADVLGLYPWPEATVVGELGE